MNSCRILTDAFSAYVELIVFFFKDILPLLFQCGELNYFQYFRKFNGVIIRSEVRSLKLNTKFLLTLSSQMKTCYLVSPWVLHRNTFLYIIFNFKLERKWIIHQINYLKSNKLLQNRNIFTMITWEENQELSHYFEPYS